MSVLKSLRLLDADDIASLVPMIDAIRALQTVMRSTDPSNALERSIIDVEHGQVLQMPAALGAAVGQKLATVAPGNPARGLDRIQGVYTLFDAATLTPRAILDGTELTSIRTPAVSAAVADLVADQDARRVVVFGSGPQAIRHVEALKQVRDISQVMFVGRDQARAKAAARAAEAFGVEARVGTASAVAGADIIVCATTAREALFAGADVRNSTTVIAVGSHEPDARELPADLMGRSQVIVESRAVAAQEAGDVIMAVAEGALAADDVVPMHDIATGAVAGATDRPIVIKTCGMGWEDLAVATLALERAKQRS